MNRKQRKYGQNMLRKNIDNKIKAQKPITFDLEEVFPPKSRRDVFNNKPMTNRSCFVSPDRRDFTQRTESYNSQESQQTSIESHIEPIIPDTIAQLKLLKNKISDVFDKIENGSQCQPPIITKFIATSDGSQWQSLEDVEEMGQYLGNCAEFTTKDPPPVFHKTSSQIIISEVPLVKVIAEKFTKYKKNNVEVRKLDEKVVCVEYDVFGSSVTGDSVPRQKMRAFFSIKPVYRAEGDEKEKSPVSELLSNIKRNFNIKDEDLEKLNKKEIEIIDDKISENKPYLEDLKKILNRKTKPSNKRMALDLLTLYKVARQEYSSLDYHFSNVLTKEELDEIKNLVLNNCTSSVHGINRRTVKGKRGDFSGENNAMLDDNWNDFRKYFE